MAVWCLSKDRDADCESDRAVNRIGLSIYQRGFELSKDTVSDFYFKRSSRRDVWIVGQFCLHYDCILTDVSCPHLIGVDRHIGHV